MSEQQTQHPAVALLVEEISSISQASVVERINLKLAHRQIEQGLRDEIADLQMRVAELEQELGTRDVIAEEVDEHSVS